MTSITVGDAGFWTTRRALGWAAAVVAWTIIPAVAIGFAAAHLRHVEPGQDWRTIGRVAALSAFTIGMALGGVKLWLDYRRHLLAAGGTPWERRADERRLAVSGIWRDCAIVGFVMGIAGTFHAVLPAGAPRVAIVAVAALALAYGMVRGTVYYMRTIDEQERDANLWGGYCGLSVYVALFFTQHLAGRFGLVVPHVHEAIFAVVLAVTAGVYLWKRFR